MAVNPSRFMNPAEEIVRYWLQQQGYFIQSSIRVPKGQNREIDILALHHKTGEMKHVEVSIAVRMAVYIGDAATKAKEYSKKFENVRIETEVRRRFGRTGPIKRVFVVGNVSIKNKDVLEEFTKECKLLNIEIISFSQILNEVASSLGSGSQLNCIIKTVQFCKEFMSRAET